jgi:membrane-bound lytic murein transglycosylase D
MRVASCLLVGVLIAGAVPSSVRAEDAEGRASRTQLFPRPAQLEPQIRFWRAIFGEYSTRQVVLHDAVRLDKIYKVLDFRHYVDEGVSADEIDRVQHAAAEIELDRLRAALLHLHRVGPDAEELSAEERRIAKLWNDDSSRDRFLEAADEKRLRSQRGLKERFAEGIRVSRRYLPEMERIFREDGLPVEVTRLPLVESCFNLHANSKVGAAGIWQFMPATGRRFMRVDNLVDERRDPLVSTRAAARYLHELHDDLGTWPLAITAYNHGPFGVARASNELDTTDIGTIVREWRGNAFGFASRNFYPEFLAALEVERHYRDYFGDMAVDAPLHCQDRRLDRALGIDIAARLAGVDREDLAALNPHLSEAVVHGRRPIPRGCWLHLPDGTGERFAARMAIATGDGEAVAVADVKPTTHRAPRPQPALLTYRVRAGQTLSHIAKQYRVSIASLCTTNGLGRATTLRAGQLLKIPKSST